jgi:nicotinamidase-related amidase
MPSSRPGSRLHGNVVNRSSVALLLIDVINPMEFPGAARFLKQVLPTAKKIAHFKRAARRRKIPVIYANDNFGLWRSNFNDLIHHCRRQKGAPLARLLKPAKDDYFVLKPKNSAFYATPLDLLLQYIGVKTLIIAGFAGNNCVFFTAQDAYIRDYRLHIPCDGTASMTPEDNQHALNQMQNVLKANVSPFSNIRLIRRHRRSYSPFG